jgi:hypothetical protein
MKGDRRKSSHREIRDQTREMIAGMSDPELANVAIMNAQNLSLDPAMRETIGSELKQEIARRNAAQQEGLKCQEPKVTM